MTAWFISIIDCISPLAACRAASSTGKANPWGAEFQVSSSLNPLVPVSEV